MILPRRWPGASICSRVFAEALKRIAANPSTMSKSSVTTYQCDSPITDEQQAE